MRDVVVHGYHRVELSIVWSIAMTQLEPLRAVVLRLVREAEDRTDDDPGN